jgi:hypothetical protein
MPKFEFNQFDHKYYIDGIEIPSVTGVLPNNIPLHITEDQLEIMRQEGNANHHAVNRYNSTGLIQPGFEIYVENYKQFLSEFSSKYGELVLWEKQLYSEQFRYGGTPDLFFESARVDLKRTYSEPLIHALQIAGYDRAAVEMKFFSKPSKKYFILVLSYKSEGKPYQLHPVWNESCFDMFPKFVQKYWIEKRIQNYFKEV